MNFKEAEQHCIFKYISGSHAYGTNMTDGSSDEDYRGVFIAPLRYGFDLFQTSTTSGDFKNNIKKAKQFIIDGFLEDAIKQMDAAMTDEGGDMTFGVSTVNMPKDSGEDAELQELRKFMKLAANNNPNIVEFLYIDKNILIEKPIWKKIKANRDLFLSKKARYTFSGYAVAQMKKIETHRNYLLNPNPVKPEREVFGLPKDSKIPPEHQNAIYSLSEEWIKPKKKEEVLKEKAYFKALRAYKSYRDWENQRNPKRKELEFKYGYDTKHASHLVRLIRMAKEILTTGEVFVHRPDADELLAIRNGAWSYDKILAFAENVDSELNVLYQTSPLQKEPNRKKISSLYNEICEEVYNIKI